MLNLGSFGPQFSWTPAVHMSREVAQSAATVPWAKWVASSSLIPKNFQSVSHSDESNYPTLSGCGLPRYSNGTRCSSEARLEYYHPASKIWRLPNFILTMSWYAFISHVPFPALASLFDSQSHYHCADMPPNHEPVTMANATCATR